MPTRRDVAARGAVQRTRGTSALPTPTDAARVMHKLIAWLAPLWRIIMCNAKRAVYAYLACTCLQVVQVRGSAAPRKSE